MISQQYSLPLAVESAGSSLPPSDVRFMVSLSGGISSWAAAKRITLAHGTEGVALVFADTFIEDQDSYRFLIECAANLLGLPVPACADECLALPEIDDMEIRRPMLKRIAADAVSALPGFHWIYEGRDPWEVMGDERVIGNSRIDPCSKILKRQLLESWRNSNCCQARTKMVLGISWDEVERILTVQERNQPWQYTAPLCEKPWISKDETLEWATREGIRPARMYPMGFAHGNCGGFCIKGGQKSFGLLLKHFPRRYMHHEGKEASAREVVGDHTILRDRSGGGDSNLTLRELRERIEAKQAIDETDIGGCACALPL